MKRYINDFFLLTVYYPYRWLVQAIPFQISYGIATLLGNIQYIFLPFPLKHKINTNLDIVFGNRLSSREKKRIIKGICITQQKKIVDLFILGREDYKKYLAAFSGDKFLSMADQLLSGGKGALGLNFHFGSVNLTGPFLIYRGYKITPILVLTSFIKNVSPWVLQKVLSIKSSIWTKRGNFQIVNASSDVLSVVKSQYRALANNEIISAAGDGALGKNFVPVDFLDVKLKVSLGPAILSAKTRAALAPTFVIRRNDNAHSFVVKEPIYVESNDEETLKETVEKYIKHLEYYVSQNPDQWAFWSRMEIEGYENGIPIMKLVPGLDEQV